MIGCGSRVRETRHQLDQPIRMEDVNDVRTYCKHGRLVNIAVIAELVIMCLLIIINGALCNYLKTINPGKG